MNRALAHWKEGDAMDSVLFNVQLAPLLILIYEPRKTNISKPTRPRTKGKQKEGPNNDVRRRTSKKEDEGERRKGRRPKLVPPATFLLDPEPEPSAPP